MGQRIETRLYAIFEGLIRAKYTAASENTQMLQATNLDLQVLRMLTRLAHELKMLPHKSHEYAARETNEIGGPRLSDRYRSIRHATHLSAVLRGFSGPGTVAMTAPRPWSMRCPHDV